MSDHVVIVPSIWQPYTDACFATMAFAPEDTIVVDNTHTNLGVAASWNIGLRYMMRNPEIRWTIIVSAGVRFTNGGLDFVQELRDWGLGWGALTNLGWHYAAVGRATVDAVGLFDENFWPGYMEDTDFMYRLHLAGMLGDVGCFHKWDGCTDTLASIGHGVHLAGVRPDGERMHDYWKAKWGHPMNEHTWTTTARPFGDHPLSYWPQPEEQHGMV